MRLLGLVLIIFFPLSIEAQNITISGKVKDRETGEVLEFASVSLKDRSIGTLTNLLGEFDFHMPVENKNDILVISMIGYHNFEAPVWSLQENPNQIIFLDKSITVLKEVVVVDSLKGGDVLRIALSRINQNFPKEPFMMDCFYRDTKKVAGNYISLLEAAAKVYDEDYAEPRNKLKLRERVQLVEIRQSLGYQNKFTDFFDQDNLLEDLLLHNSIRYRQIDVQDENLFSEIEKDDDSYYNGHDVYVLNYVQGYKLTVYVDKTDFSIVHMEYEIGPSNSIIDKKKNLVSKESGLKKIIDFRRFEGVMYLNYMVMTSKVNWYEAQTDKLNFETELFQQLLVNKVYKHTKERIASNQKMRSYGLQYQDLPYNKAFWDNYNVIKDSPVDKEVVRDLEKQIPLEEQFKQEN